MSHPDRHHHVVPDLPEHLQLSPLVRGIAVVCLLAGAAALVWGFSQGHTELAWSSYLIGVFFTLGLGVFGVAWISILYLAGADWSITMRRIPEAMTAWLLPGGVLALLVGLGAHSLYHWSHAEAVAKDALLTHKAPFLNMQLFYILTGLSLVLWIVFAWVMVGGSRRQDEEGGVAITKRNHTLSAIFLVVFALTISVVGFYLLMSLEAHWFSTMFAVLVFTDVVQTGTAFVAVVVGLLMTAGRLNDFVKENHLHSLGKMVFASTGFWAYIYFCQFLLIWYANIPEETVYFIKRADNGWLPYFLILPAIKFLVPFLILLPHEAKREPERLVPVSLLILFAQFWELYLMVGPAVGHGEHAAHGHVPLVEFAVTIGFVGLFLLVFGWTLARHNPIPKKDPALPACLHYH